MRRKIVLYAGIPFLCLSLLGYAAWPALSMYQIEQAIKAGDEATLEAKVNWDTTRRSFSEATKHVADHELKKRTEQLAQKGKSTVLLNIASLMSPAIIDQVVESYATPKGLIELSRNGWKIDIQKLAPQKAVAVPGADEKTNKKVNDTIGKVSGFLKYYKEFEDAKKETREHESPGQSEPQDTLQFQQGSVMQNAGSETTGNTAKDLAQDQHVADGRVQMQNGLGQQEEAGKRHRKIGYENLRFFGVMGFTSPREFTIGVAKDPEKQTPDIIAVLRFEGFDWKIVELRPQPQM